MVIRDGEIDDRICVERSSYPCWVGGLSFNGANPEDDLWTYFSQSDVGQHGAGPDGYNQYGKHYCEWRGKYEQSPSPSTYGGVPALSFWEMGQHCNDGMGDPVSGEPPLIDNEYDAIIKCQGNENMTWMGMEPMTGTTLRPYRDEEGMVTSPCEWVTGVGCRKRQAAPQAAPRVPITPCWMGQIAAICHGDMWYTGSTKDEQFRCYEDFGLSESADPMFRTIYNGYGELITLCQRAECQVADDDDTTTRCDGGLSNGFQWSGPNFPIYSPCAWEDGECKDITGDQR